MPLQGSSAADTLHKEFEGLCTMPLDVLVSTASMPCGCLSVYDARLPATLIKFSP